VYCRSPFDPLVSFRLLVLVGPMLLENDALNDKLIALPRFQHQVIAKIADSNEPGGRDAALTNQGLPP
jgi:hypothetical protein